MIRVISYSSTKAKKTSLSSLNSIRETAWIDVFNPDEKELKQIYDKFGISKSHLKCCLKKRELSHLINTLKYTLIIFTGPNLGNTLPLGIFVSKRHVLTVHSKKMDSLEDLKKTILKKEDKELLKSGPHFLAHKIMFEIIKDYDNNTTRIEDQIDKLENKIFKHASEQEVQTAFSLKRKLLFFRRALTSNHNVISDLQKGTSNFMPTKIYGNFTFLYNEISHIISDVDLSRDRLSQVMDMYMSSVSNRMNDTMKSFTVVASLILLPTLLSGIWGMNFKNIPWFYNTFGFYFPIILMIASVVTMLIFFKLKKWI